MLLLESLTQRIESGENLTAEEARRSVDELSSADVDAEPKRAFLSALHSKGETASEVAAFATVFRELARNPGLEDFAARGIDIVGTGGSSSGSYNISSAAAITVAAMGVPVLKHGNRAVTSKSGAADFLGKVGVPQNPPLELLRKSLEELNFCFFFAPAFHPAFKEIIPVRALLAEHGQRSIFNILGPLVNPAQPAYQLLGVFSSTWVRPLAEAMHRLGLKRGLTVHADLGNGACVDELSCAGSNYVAGFGDFSGIEAIWSPRDLGLAECAPADIIGGTPDENYATFLEIVSGKGHRGLIDTISLNAGAALWITGEADDIRTGATRSRDALRGGTVKQWLEKARDVYSTLV